MKDIEKPDKYANYITKLTIWYERFRDLLEHCHPNWQHVFNAIEKAGKTRIASVEDLLNLVDSDDTKIKQSIKDQSQMYMCQLKAYLRTYIGGELHVRQIYILLEPNLVLQGVCHDEMRLIERRAG